MDLPHILIIDDDQEDIQILKEALVECGLNNVVFFAKSEDGLLYLNSIKEAEQLPIIILTSIILPIKSGIEFLKEVKSHTNLKHIPVVLISSAISKRDQKIGYNLGADDILQKPYNYPGYVNIAERIKEKLTKTLNN